MTERTSSSARTSSLDDLLASLVQGPDGLHTGVMAAADGAPRDVVLDPMNRRLKLYRLAADDLDLPAVRQAQAALEGDDPPFTKLIVYGRPGREMDWVRRGFVREGVILGYFADGADAWIWSAFTEGQRDLAPRDARHDEIVALAAAKPTVEPDRPEGYRCRTAEADDAAEVSALLRTVFSAYPSPLDEAAIERRIDDGEAVYRLLENEDGVLCAAAAAEIDRKRASAELTDCATRPEHRGAGMMAYLLHRLERDLVERHGITDIYTIARADEVGMNCVFSKLGYVYTGRLVNNCRMPGGWESMNLWCRADGEGDGPAG